MSTAYQAQKQYWEADRKRKDRDTIEQLKHENWILKAKIGSFETMLIKLLQEKKNLEKQLREKVLEKSGEVY